MSTVAAGAESCPKCGAQLGQRPIPFFPDAANWSAPGAAPAPTEGVSSHARSFTVAPLWRRAGSTCIDALPIGGAFMLSLLAFEKKLEQGHAPILPRTLEDLARMYWSLQASTWLVVALVLAVVVLYQTFCLGFMHATVGDLVFGLCWVTRDGSPPKPLRAFVRVLLLVPSWLFAGAGVWVLLLARTRRAFYDIASGCYLVLREDAS